MSDIQSQFSLSIIGLNEVSHGLINNTSYVVSLVDPGTVLPRSLELVNCERHLVLRMHDALDSADGRVAPTREDVLALCRYADKINHEQLSHLIVHCHMGRSRSAAAAVILLLRLGWCASPSDAFKRVRAIRDPVWPNWTLLKHGDEVLGYRGELLRESEVLYKEVQKCFPKWVEDPRPENVLARVD